MMKGYWQVSGVCLLELCKDEKSVYLFPRKHIHIPESSLRNICTYMCVCAWKIPDFESKAFLGS